MKPQYSVHPSVSYIHNILAKFKTKTGRSVYEWVADWYDEYYYFDSPGNDPRGPASGELKVVRGGCWASPAADCRCAARKSQHPDRPANTIGFRVVLMVDGK